MPVIVERFDGSLAPAADLAAWCETFSNGQRELSGGSLSPSALAAELRRDTSPVVRLAARRSAPEPIVGVAALRPQDHQPGVGFLRLFVAPASRRIGLGSALLTRMQEEASGIGLQRIQGTVLAGPPGEPFARASDDLRVVLALVLQEQRLDDRTVLDQCRRLATSPDREYRLAKWAGAVPDHLALSFARVMAHVLDAPDAELQMPARDWDAAAVRRWEASMTAGGQQLLVCAAVHAGTKEVVAATVSTVPAGGDGTADQHDTAVLPEYRRRGLARWVKANQTLRLHEEFPSLHAVAVTVNQRNAPMLSVNDAVGYRAIRERLLVEMPVPS